MTLTGKSRPFGLLMMRCSSLCQPCSTSDGAKPTSLRQLAAPFSSPSQTVTSTSSQTSASSSFTKTSAPAVHRNIPLASRPDSRPSRRSAGSDRCLRGLLPSWSIRPYGPRQGLDVEVSKWATDPVEVQLSAQHGGNGSARAVRHRIDRGLSPGNEGGAGRGHNDGLCRFHRLMGFYDKAGNSIKAPMRQGRTFGTCPRCR